MGLFLIPSDPGGTLEMPTVTPPMTGRTVAATTTSSVSPKTSGVKNVFLPRQTELRSEKKKKDYNPHKEVVFPASECMDDVPKIVALVRKKLKTKKSMSEWRREPLRVTEGFFDRLIGKKQQPSVPAPAPAVQPVGISKAPPKPKRNYGVPELSPAEKKQWRPGKQEPVSADALGNLVQDPDYEKVGSSLHQSGAWGKETPPGEQGEHGLTGEPETPHAERSTPSSQAGGSSFLTKTPTRAPTRTLGSSGDRKMPSGSAKSNSQTFLRSRSSTATSDRIDPAD